MARRNHFRKNSIQLPASFPRDSGKIDANYKSFHLRIHSSRLSVKKELYIIFFVNFRAFFKEESLNEYFPFKNPVESKIGC